MKGVILACTATAIAVGGVAVLGDTFAANLFGGSSAKSPSAAAQYAQTGESPNCYWTRGQPVWDDGRGIWTRPRIQVCD
jgi:hypothetical protein